MDLPADRTPAAPLWVVPAFHLGIGSSEKAPGTVTVFLLCIGGDYTLCCRRVESPSRHTQHSGNRPHYEPGTASKSGGSSPGF